MKLLRTNVIYECNIRYILIFNSYYVTTNSLLRFVGKLSLNVEKAIYFLQNLCLFLYILEWKEMSCHCCLGAELGEGVLADPPVPLRAEATDGLCQQVRVPAGRQVLGGSEQGGR